MTKYLCKYINVVDTNLDECKEGSQPATFENIVNSLSEFARVEEQVEDSSVDIGFTVFRLSKPSRFTAKELNDALIVNHIDTVVYVDHDDADINKAVFIHLLWTLDDDRYSDVLGETVADLTEKLTTSDFFYAPATTRAHCNFEGGLCLHSLNVYFNMLQEIKNKSEFAPSNYDSIKICGLLHDISRVNYYEKSAKNVKVYSKAGSKTDELGRFDWEAQTSYKVKDSKDRFIYGSLEQTSLYIIKKFLKLTMYEEIAILHALGQENQERDSSDNTALIFSKYPLATLLHIADLQASYLDEFDFDEEGVNE